MIDIELTGIGRSGSGGRVDASASVPGFDVTIDEMRRSLAGLYATGGGPRAAVPFATDPLRPGRGMLYFSVAVLAGAVGVAAAWLTRAEDFDGTPGWLLFGGLGLAAAFYFGLRGAVCFRPRAETVVARDGRAPVIYLRSFRDDQATVRRPVRLSRDLLSWRFILTEYTRGGLVPVLFQRGRVRLEQAIEDAAAMLGPFIAIGEPHERHPDFGATRAYFEGDDVAWRTAVAAWIGRARLVVFVPGQTQGLAWELGAIQKAGATDKLLLLFPPEADAPRASRVAALRGMLTQPQWLTAIGSDAGADLVAVFEATGGEVVRVRARNPRLADVQFAVELALYGMFRLRSVRA